jgi:hypothetical protein
MMSAIIHALFEAGPSRFAGARRMSRGECGKPGYPFAKLAVRRIDLSAMIAEAAGARDVAPEPGSI